MNCKYKQFVFNCALLNYALKKRLTFLNNEASYLNVLLLLKKTCLAKKEGVADR